MQDAAALFQRSLLPWSIGKLHGQIVPAWLLKHSHWRARWPGALLASPSIPPPFSDRLIRDGKVHLARVDGLAIGSYRQCMALWCAKNRCFTGKLAPLVEFVVVTMQAPINQAKDCGSSTSHAIITFLLASMVFQAMRCLPVTNCLL